MNDDEEFDIIPTHKFKPSSDSEFDEIPTKFITQNIQSKESPEEENGRTAYQLLSGYLNATSPGIIANFWDLLSRGELYDEEELDRLRTIGQREGKPFDEQAYMQAAEDALSHLPTVGNIERILEEHTGLPLQAKTGLQKSIKLGSSAATLQPGSLVQKGAAAISAPIASSILQKAGVPEQLAEIAGLATGVGVGKVSPSVEISRVKKPSGLTARRFENVKVPTEVSQGKVKKINSKLEEDFRSISDEIISKSPIENTRAQLKENPLFKSEVAEKFRDVERLAESMPEVMNTDTVKQTLVNNALKNNGTGFAPSEYDQDYRKFVQKFLKETPSQKIGAADLVKQYRKNNKSLSEAYDPGRSYAFNRAKKDAILEYNRAIAQVIDEEFPNSEFSNLFKRTNKQWAELSDAQAMDKFFDGLFEGKINFDKARKFFDNENLSRPFKRALGDEGYVKFQQLMKDLLESEMPYKMLRQAKQAGWNDLAETAGAFILHPKIGKAKLVYSAGKKGWQSIMTALLDQPQLAVRWRSGLDHLKKGNFAEAEVDFNELKNRLKLPIPSDNKVKKS